MATAVLTALALPAQGLAQTSLTPEGQQDRRALMASLFADRAREADTSWYVYENGGFGERRGRIPSLNFAIAAQTVVELYRADPSFDPRAAAVALSSGLEQACDDAACGAEDLASWTLPRGLQAIRRGDGAQLTVCDPTCREAFTPALKERYRRAVSQVGETMALGTPLNSAQSLRDGLGDPDLEEVARALLECAEKNPLCLKAANETFKQWMGVGFDASVAQINASGFVAGETKTVRTVVDGQTLTEQIQIPRLPVRLDPTTGVLQKKDGSPIDKAGMVAAVEGGFATANAAVSGGTADTKSLLEAKRVLQADRNKLADAELKKFIADASKREAQIKEAGKLVSLFAQAIKLTGDDKLADQIATVGNAAVEIATGVNDVVTGLVNVGASVATGNVVGAIVGGVGLITKAMGVANSINGLFGGRTEANTKPEDPVAKQIKALAGQMTDLKKAMNARFDRIEDGLDQVFGTLVEGFNEMDARFDNLDQGVDEVQAKLVKQSYRLDQLERNMRHLNRTTEDRRLWERINTALGFRQRNGELFSRTVFDEHASVFYTHAKPGGHAFDTIALSSEGGALGTSDGPTQDESVMSRLGPPNPAEIPFLDPEDPSSMLPAGSQLEENVNYLSYLASSRFGGAAFATTLPNIRDWALAGRAYARMLIEQPERAPLPPAGQASDPRLAEIESVGQQAKAQLASFARNGTLFTRLLDNHEDRSKDRDGSGRGLYEELRSLEQAFVGRVGLSYASLYGGGRVAPPMNSLSLSECGRDSGREQLSVPSNVTWASMLEPQFLVAHKRGAGKARVCWDAEWVDVRKADGCVGLKCESWGKLRVTMKGQWRPEASPEEPGSYRTLRTRTYTKPTEEQICEEEINEETTPPIRTVVCMEASFVTRNEWGYGLKAAFEQNATVGADTAGLADEVLAIARTELDEAQVELRADLLGNLGRHTDNSFPAAGLALERLTGAKVIVQSFLNLGLSRALAKDERLRGLLYGADAILDRALVEDEIIPNYRRNEDGSLVRDGSGNLVRDLTDRDQDPIERLKDQEAERIGRLRDSISGWQAQLAAGTHSENHPLIDATLAELQMARLVAYSRSECSDGRDNDGDGRVDHGTDPDCQSRADDSEKALPPPVNTVKPVITGTPRDGQVLSASNGSWSGTPTSFGYAWQRCDRNGAACVPIAGATGPAYRAGPADVGRRLRVAVIARNAVGTKSALSDATAIVAAVPPRNTALPKISGSARVGSSLSATSGTWSGTAPLGLSYRWLRCNTKGLSCTTITGATARTYRLARADLGRRLRVMVTARNAVGTASALSGATAIVAAVPPRNTALPNISGTARLGRSLSAAPGRWTGTAPIGFRYRWLRCNRKGLRCTTITRATGRTYRLARADLGRRLRVRVTARNAGGTAGALSAPTRTVTR